MGDRWPVHPWWSHLAGPPSVAASFHDPVGYLRAHVEGTANVVEAARRADVHRAGPGVLGRGVRAPPVVPGRRGRGNCAAVALGAAKVGAEAVAGAAARSGVLDQVVVVRPFSVYGPGMADWSLIGSLAQQARGGGPLEVRDPRPVRDYVHVDDVSAALVAAARVPLDGNRSTFNLCSGVGRPPVRLRDAWPASSGWPSSEGHLDGDRPVGADITELVGDPAAAASRLGGSHGPLAGPMSVVTGTAPGRRTGQATMAIRGGDPCGTLTGAQGFIGRFVVADLLGGTRRSAIVRPGTLGTHR